jgi:hypothetical protein
VYDNAARIICRDLRQEAFQLGVPLLEDTPGAWETSDEIEANGLEGRRFLLTVGLSGTQVGVFRLTFWHRHECFDLPVPPGIEIYGKT